MIIVNPRAVFTHAPPPPGKGYGCSHWRKLEEGGK
jgi:hypothetical protein